MKKIIISILIFLIVFLIYYFNISEKTYYLSLGDYLAYGINNLKEVDNNYSDNIKNYHKDKLSNYINYSYYDDYRVMDLINDINYNKLVIYENKEYRIQNLLIKANLITISIGMNDLIYKSKLEDDLYEYTDQLLKDIENLQILVRKYNKDQIYFLSFYNAIDNEELINYANKRLESICNKNNIKIIDISLLGNYLIDGIYPTNDGYAYITSQILQNIKKVV